jgi:hypothetical protein
LNKKLEEIKRLLNDLVGMPLWDLYIGPCGIGLHLGEKIVIDSLPLLFEGQIISLPPDFPPDSEISLLVMTNTFIRYNDEIFVSSEYPQDKKEEDIYIEHFLNKIVTGAKMDQGDNSLHLIFHDGTILSATPSTHQNDLCWAIYDHRKKDLNGLVVFSDLEKGGNN